MQMAAGLVDQLGSAGTYDELSFCDRLGLLVDKEADARDSRRLADPSQGSQAPLPGRGGGHRLPIAAGLDRSVVLSLAEARFVASHQNVVVTGATGCGKSFVACALANAAIRQGHTALYARTPRLIDELSLGRADGRYARLLAAFRGLTSRPRRLLAHPGRRRGLPGPPRGHRGPSQLRSTMVVSQLPVEKWHAAMSDPTLAEAVLDRILQSSHRIAMKGPSMRKRQPAEASQ